jgi:hypothetical protein
MPLNERDGFGSARLITEDDTCNSERRANRWEVFDVGEGLVIYFLDLGKLDPLAEPCMSGTRPFSPALYQDK